MHLKSLSFVRSQINVDWMIQIQTGAVQALHTMKHVGQRLNGLIQATAGNRSIVTTRIKYQVCRSSRTDFV
jgi:hypothetical protein